MAWNQMLTNLRDVLADLYYTQELARRVVEAAAHSTVGAAMM